MANPFRSIRLFYSETLQELKKSSWPDRKELRNMTLVTIFAMVLLALAIVMADFALYNLVQLFTELAIS